MPNKMTVAEAHRHPDTVNHPSYYSGPVECIDAIRSATTGRQRAGRPDGAEGREDYPAAAGERA